MTFDRNFILRTLGCNLMQCRYQSGLTQKQVADKLLMPRTTLSDAETGIRNPSVIQIYQLAQFYKISMDELMKPPDTKFAIGNREELTRRRLASGASVQEVRSFDQTLHDKDILLPPKGSVRIPAGSSGSREILVCHTGDVWVQSELDSQWVRKGQTLEMEAHLPKIIYGSEDGSSSFTLVRVKL